MSGPIGRAWWGGLLLACALALPATAGGTGKPAELPPASFRGLQYVDSQGCVFMRAGTEAETLWVPRVTAAGQQLCGYPPSGNRVPIVGEPGADAGPFGEEAAASGPAPVAPKTSAPEPVDDGSYVVALGSFGFESNVRKAMAATEALGYAVVTGQLKGGEQGLTTVFAGPFKGKAAALAALEKLRQAGFPDALLLKN